MRVDIMVSKRLAGQAIGEFLTLYEGQELNAVILSIREEIIQLMFNESISLQARLKEPIPLQKGQKVKLAVTKLEENEIQLSVVHNVAKNGEKASPAGKNPLPGRPNPVNRAHHEAAVGKGHVESHAEGHIKSPINESYIKDIMRMIDVIIKNPGKLMPDDDVSQKEIIDLPVDKLFQMPVKSEGKGEPARDGFEGQDLWVANELEKVKPDDIIRLVKLGRDLNPLNLIIAKNIREGKGIVKPLLKELFGTGTKQTGGRAGAEQAETYGRESKVDILDIKEIVARVLQRDGKHPESMSSGIKVLSERVLMVNKAYSTQNCIVLPLMYGGEFEEALAIIRKFKKGGPSGKNLSDSAEVEIIAHLQNLGEVRVIINVLGKDVALGFFTENDYSAGLINAGRAIISENAKNKGYNIVAVSCKRLERELFGATNYSFDIRV